MAQMVKNPACTAGDPGLVPASGRPSRRRGVYTTQHICSGESHGQRSLTGLQSMGSKELNRTERPTLHFFKRDEMTKSVNSRRRIRVMASGSSVGQCGASHLQS